MNREDYQRAARELRWRRNRVRIATFTLVIAATLLVLAFLMG